MKTKHILFILFLIYSTRGTILAQDTLLVDPVKIDSLQTLINQSKEDKEKVRLLNEYSRLNFYNQEYKTGLIATVDARELAAKINFSGGEVLFHITIATFLGRHDLQAYHLSQARILSVQNNETDLYIIPTYPKGYPPAPDNELIEKLLAVLPYFEKTGNKEIQAILLNPIVLGYYYQGNYKKLKIFQDKAIKLYTGLNQLYPLFLYHKYRMMLANGGLVEGDKKRLENELKELLTRTTNKNELIPFYHQLAGFYSQLGQPAIAIDYFLKSVEYYESYNDLIMLNEVYGEMAGMYQDLEMYYKQAEIVEKRIEIIEQLDNPERYIWVYRFGVWTMHAAKRYDKAREYMEFAIQKSAPNQSEALKAQKNSLEGQILMDYNRYEEAMPYLIKSYNFYSKIDSPLGRGTAPWEAMHLAYCYYGIADLDEALRFGKIALEKQYSGGDDAIRLDRKINLILYEVYNALEEESQAFKYLKLHHDLVEKAKTKDNANLIMEAEVRSVLQKSEIEITRLEQEKITKEQQNKTQRLWIFSIAGALLSALLVAIILYRNNKNKQKANTLLKEQKEEIQVTLEKLESTQSQLIQSEKMASLGELTAGIAHEIQNPLNFVNNFSEVSIDLIEEMNEEIASGNMDEVKDISGDIKQNLDKINYHGNRASSIVRGMLSHSRTGNEHKELTDINKLADEYLRLAYHGLRAKDKTFNADFNTDLDERLPKVNVISQDISRVLLNLINNAFYAVSKKVKENAESYKPIVTVSTASYKFPSGDLGVEIRVKDNGDGIPKGLKDKIFQPFFTTKPTGEGTGLGLSLSYDIITKSHNGTLKVETKEGQGTEFTIILPNK